MENENIEKKKIETSAKIQTNTQGTKTILLGIIGIITIIVFITAGIYILTQQNFLIGVAVIFAGFASFAFISGFSDIIDLLESINNKLNTRNFKDDEK